MADKIVLETEGKEIMIEFNSSGTAAKIKDSLPISSITSKWGGEIYFSIPVETGIEDAIEVMEIGDVAYWPPGQAFCIFFGKTPASIDDKPRAASPVTIVGKIKGKDCLEELEGLIGGNEVGLRIL